MQLRPFRAWRPTPDQAKQVASLPYDVVDTAEARKQAEGHPLCFFHITRPEIDLPDEINPFSDAAYAKAGENFKRFQSTGILRQESAPCLYIYRLVRNGRAQTGMVGVFSVDEYLSGVIKRHEKTRKAPEDDRTKHILATSAQTGPVFLAYRDQPAIDAEVRKITNASPLFDFIVVDGIQHTIWKVSEPAVLTRLFQKVPAAYIADGHHRAASAARVAREKRAAQPAYTGQEEFNFFQAAIFPASQLTILPYNRCVKDLNGLSETEFMNRVRTLFIVKADAAPAPTQPARISMYFRNRWHELSWPKPETADPVAHLDVSVLQDLLLGPVLGIDDPRTDPRIVFVGGIRGTDELVKRVRSEKAAVAFSMYPTTIDQLMAIADAGKTMPPKSTWFEPKLRDGLLVHTLED